MRRACCALLAALVVLGGCAVVPSSGPVTEVVDDGGFGQSTVRYSPAPPVDGALPGEIVRGYLDAMLAYPASTRAAAAFLTPEAADDWQPQSGVTVYRDAQVATVATGGSRREAAADVAVGLDILETGRLDAEGRYSEGRGVRGTGFTVVRSDGQWRISDPPPGLMVTAKFFADYFRPFTLYYFDRPAERLVPQPVHLLVDDRLAAALVTALARGGRDESGQLRTFVPGVDDLRATVPVTGGLADVGFTGGSREEADTRRMSAQIVWTLRQVPGIGTVRISVGAGPIEPYGSAQQPISAWQEFGAPDGDGAVHALNEDRVVGIDGTDVEPIDGPFGEDAGGAVGVAVAGDRVALVDAGRSSVRVAERSGDVLETLTGDGLLDPVSDVDGNVWLVDRPEGGTRIRVIGASPSGAEPVDLDAGDLADLDVRSVDISPDGSRYVVTVGAGPATSVRVGRVLRGGDGAVVGLGAPRRLDLGTRTVRSAVWSDGVRISFLAATSAGTQVQTALIDGSSVSGGSTGGRALLPDVDARSLAIGSGADQASYVLDADGRLWVLAGSRSWTPVADVGPVRSLDHDR